METSRETGSIGSLAICLLPRSMALLPFRGRPCERWGPAPREDRRRADQAHQAHQGPGRIPRRRRRPSLHVLPLLSRSRRGNEADNSKADDGKVVRLFIREEGPIRCQGQNCPLPRTSDRKPRLENFQGSSPHRGKNSPGGGTRRRPRSKDVSRRWVERRRFRRAGADSNQAGQNPVRPGPRWTPPEPQPPASCQRSPVPLLQRQGSGRRCQSPPVRW